MTVTAKNKSVKTSLTAKNGLSLGLAILLSAGGALVVMVGGRMAVARTAAFKTAQIETPGPGAPTVGPNAAPSPQLPDPPSEVSPTESPTLETAPPEAPVLEPTPTETLTPEPAPTETLEPTPTESPILEPDPAPTEVPGTSISTEVREANIVFVKTAEDSATREIPGYAERFSDIVGSGRLLVNSANQVTGYYFTLSGLPASQTLPYHFHAAKKGSQPTSCEGDKELVEGETAGEVITDLSEATPLQVGGSGIAVVGIASNPVQLSSPVALEDIGYLNIHSPEGSPGPGIVCANVRLDPGGFVREMPEPVESEEGGDLEDETVGPNSAPEPQEPTLEEPVDTAPPEVTPPTETPSEVPPAEGTSDTVGPNAAPEPQMPAPSTP